MNARPAHILSQKKALAQNLLKKKSTEPSLLLDQQSQYSSFVPSSSSYQKGPKPPNESRLPSESRTPSESRPANESRSYRQESEEGNANQSTLYNTLNQYSAAAEQSFSDNQNTRHFQGGQPRPVQQFASDQSNVSNQSNVRSNQQNGNNQSLGNQSAINNNQSDSNNNQSPRNQNTRSIVQSESEEIDSAISRETPVSKGQAIRKIIEEQVELYSSSIFEQVQGEFESRLMQISNRVAIVEKENELLREQVLKRTVFFESVPIPDKINEQMTLTRSFAQVSDWTMLQICDRVDCNSLVTHQGVSKGTTKWNQEPNDSIWNTLLQNKKYVCISFPQQVIDNQVWMRCWGINSLNAAWKFKWILVTYDGKKILSDFSISLPHEDVTRIDSALRVRKKDCDQSKKDFESKRDYEPRKGYDQSKEDFEGDSDQSKKDFEPKRNSDQSKKLVAKKSSPKQSPVELQNSKIGSSHTSQTESFARSKNFSVTESPQSSPNEDVQKKASIPIDARLGTIKSNSNEPPNISGQSSEEYEEVQEYDSGDELVDHATFAKTIARGLLGSGNQEKVIRFPIQKSANSQE